MEATKRPWMIDPDNTGIITVDRDVTGDIICEAPEEWDESMKSWPANAAFIIKAANHHDALVAALRVLASVDPFDENDRCIHCGVTLCRYDHAEDCHVVMARTLLAEVGNGYPTTTD